MAKRNTPGTSKKKKNLQRQAQRDPNLAQQLKEKEEERLAQRERGNKTPSAVKEFKSTPRKSAPVAKPSAPKKSRDGRLQRRVAQAIVILMAAALVGTMAITALGS